MRWALAAMMVLHGAIHLLGAAKGFGLVELPQLAAISRPQGVAWLLAGLAMLAAAFLPLRWFWVVGFVAVALSQAVLFGAWHDAKFGTVANVLVLAGVVYAFAAEGPFGLRAEYREAVRSELSRARVGGVVTEAELAPLPPPVQRYLRAVDAVGQPKVNNFKLTWKGRIRGGPTEPWMTFDAEQHNFYGALPSRLFLMDAVMKGLPVDVFHRFEGEAATFRVRVLSLVQLVFAKGPEMNRSETVTIFNDLCFFAPAALIDPAIQWEPLDEHHVRARYTRGPHTISAELVFNDAGELVDFVSDDRSMASSDGKTFTPLRWTTPVRDYRTYGLHRVASRGEARWETPDGGFVYGEFEVVGLEYDVAPRYASRHVHP